MSDAMKTEAAADSGELVDLFPGRSRPIYPEHAVPVPHVHSGQRFRRERAQADAVRVRHAMKPVPAAD